MKQHHVFPWWAGYLLINPMRKRSLDPEKLLGHYIEPGMKILDAGCAMGFFSIPMAHMTGPRGRIYCVDPQEKMLRVLEKRAGKKGLSDIIEARLCSFESLMTADLKESIDLALAFAVFHEAEDKQAFITEIRETLAPGGILVFGEPHVISSSEFMDEVAMITEKGFVVVETLKRGNNNIAVMIKGMG